MSNDETMIPDAPAPEADIQAAAERQAKYDAFMAAKSKIEQMQSREMQLAQAVARNQELIDDYETFTALRDSQGYKRLMEIMDAYFEQSSRHDPLTDANFQTWSVWHRGQQDLLARLKFNVMAKAGGEDGPAQFASWKDSLRLSKHALAEVAKAKAAAMKDFMALHAADGEVAQ